MPATTQRPRTGKGGRWVLTGLCLFGWASSTRAIAPTITRTAIAVTAAAPCTHLVFVVDTSAAMRDPKSGRLPGAIFQAILTALSAHPDVRGLQMFDADGRRMLAESDEWQPCSPNILLGIERTLNRYTTSTVPNPIPGIVQALKRLPTLTGADAKLQVLVIGDTFVSRGQSVLCRLDELNPTNARGVRPVVISVLQTPSAWRSASGSDAGATKPGSSETFRTLMSEVAQQHGGTFRRLGGS